MFTYKFRCGTCGHRWVPKRQTWSNPTVRCPACGQRSTTPNQPSAAKGCLAIILLIAIIGFVSMLFRR